MQPVTDLAPTRRDREPRGAAADLAVPGGVGACLGLLAVAVDRLPGEAGLVATVAALATTGLGWGVAALVLGARAGSWRRAAVRGPVVLLAATAAYYGLIVLTGARQDAGTGAQLRAAAVWAAASLLAGPVLGGLGWLLRSGTPAGSATAAGVLGGVLAGQGLTYLVADPATILRMPPSSWSLTVLLMVLLPAAGALWWGLRRGRPGPAVAALLVAAALGAAGWAAILSLLR